MDLDRLPHVTYKRGLIMMENAWIIPLFPLLSFLDSSSIRKRLKEASFKIGIFLTLLSTHFFDTCSCLSDLPLQPIKVKHFGLQ